MRLGFFTRLLDDVDAGERYRLATEQIRCGERFGLHSAWVAQHHFSASEGGLPSPLVFLAHVAAKTSRIRLGTGIITLPLEIPLRVAEDTSVLDLLSGGRLEVGLGPGGTPSSFASFGQDNAERTALFEGNLAALRSAWRGETLAGGVNRLYPSASGLPDRVWQATFTVYGGRRAGEAGDGLMLSRTQPRPQGSPGLTLAQIQDPIIDGYLDALPPGRAPRILASRSVFVADDRPEARRLAAIGLRRQMAKMRAAVDRDDVDAMMRTADSHIGTPEEVIASLAADRTLDRATDVTFQVHSIDPPHRHILRCIELMATVVAPALGWTREADAETRLAAAQ
ncbi:MAG: putative FMN-dependent luciferase-like monooxygenase [Acetobacteraceae bacterium]|nr:putative FMN-dependent luciferase-like monooxygenase [Acetobacteraceae bacterium]